MVRAVHAETRVHSALIRELFREYEKHLGVDLCFQNFEKELAGLPGKYGPPHGCLLLAMEETDAAGCMAARPLEAHICEMKRLYVRPSYRGLGLGRLLIREIIEEAHGFGYSRMRLDTLTRLKPANSLYEALGFKQIAPYYSNPLPGVVYWELKLDEVLQGVFRSEFNEQPRFRKG